MHLIEFERSLLFLYQSSFSSLKRQRNANKWPVILKLLQNLHLKKLYWQSPWLTSNFNSSATVRDSTAFRSCFAALLEMFGHLKWSALTKTKSFSPFSIAFYSFNLLCVTCLSVGRYLVISPPSRHHEIETTSPPSEVASPPTIRWNKLTFSRSLAMVINLQNTDSHCVVMLDWPDLYLHSGS